MPVKWRVRARMRDFRSSRALLSGEAESQGIKAHSAATACGSH